MADNPPNKKPEVSGAPHQDNRQAPPDKTTRTSRMSAADQTSLPQIPDHQLLSCIGRGAYGEVWLARTVVGTFHAVKVVYRKSFETDRPYEREFAGIQKFEPISRSHEALVNVLHVGRNEAAGYFYYVMELADDVVSGEKINPDNYLPKTLQREIERRSRLPVEECVRVSRALASGLGHLHEQGLVHRDIKPANIIFVKGAPRLADIGLVAATEATQSYVGTQGYIPPEGPGTPQADLYSLGKVFYEMSTGKDRQEFPDLPTALRENTERVALLEFNEVLVKACANDVRQRYQSAQELEADLSLLQVGESVKSKRVRQHRWAMARGLGIAAALAGLVAAALWFAKVERASQRATALAEPQSIAVLPFVGEGLGRADEYLSESLPDEIIQALGRISGLKVASRNSSFAFKGKNEGGRVIGERLGVRHVLQGSVRKSGDKLHITAELINSVDGFQVLFLRYDKEVKDLLSIPGDVTRQVAARLKVTLGADDARRLGRRPTENLEAYASYMQGRYFFNNRGARGMVETAMTHFNDAIKQDPSFAAAYAGLAFCYAVRGSWESGDLAPVEAEPKAKDFARQAQQLDPTLAEPHATLGYVYTHYDRDWIGAEEEFKEALRLDPNCENAHHWYGHLLMALGREKEALAESEHYRNGSPADVFVYIHFAWHFVFARQPDQAINAVQKVFALRPDHFWGYYFLGVADEQKAMWTEAITALEKAVKFSSTSATSVTNSDSNTMTQLAFSGLGGNSKKFLAALGHAYALANRRQDALTIIADLEKRSMKGEYVPAFEIALIHLGLGDKDAALKWLETAYQQHSGWEPYLNIEPRLDPLREEPGFKDLLIKVGLPLPPESKSIAVLPFLTENLSVEDADLSEGIPESIISILTKISGLKVKPRNSSFLFWRTNSSPRAIGEQLKVRTVLGGSVRKAGDRLHINAELISTETGFQLMSQPYDCQMNDLPTVPSDIAKRIAAALKIPLGAEATQRVIEKPTEHPEAWRLYVRGRVFWNHRAEGKLKTALDCFNQAIELDPAFALAYSGLADCYSSQVFTYDAGSLSPVVGMPKSQWAAGQALKLARDSELAECLTSQAFVKLIYEWNWPEAERGFTQALQRNPRYAHGHHWHSHYLMAMGQTNASLAESQAALKLEPGDFIINIHLGWHYLFVRDYASALKQFQQTQAMYPDNPLTHRYLGLAYQQLGKHSEAIDEFKRAAYLSPTNSIMLGGLGHALAMAGRMGEARLILAELEKLSKDKYVSPYFLALVHAGLGEKQEAFRLLYDALSQRCDALVYLKQDPWLDSLRDDSRFSELVRKVGLPQ